MLGKWYATAPARYYQISGKNIDYYKMYVFQVGDDLYYDSFYLVEGQVIASKVDKKLDPVHLQKEIDRGALVRTKNKPNLIINPSMRISPTVTI